MIAPFAFLPPDRSARRSGLGAAIRGAVITGILVGGAMVWRGPDILWIALAALGALVLIVVVEGVLRQGDHTAHRYNDGAGHFGVADTLLSHIPDPVILVDRRAIVIEGNEAAKALLPGLRTMQPLSFALRSPDVLGAIDTVLETGEPLKTEYSERVPAERAFEVHASPLQDDAQQADTRLGVVLFFRDLTSARRLEHMRVDFVANASHELRTPLASLLGFIETLQGPARNDPAARDRFLEVMREQAQRMTRLIDDLLSLSRIELRAHVPPSAAVDLRSIVTHMIDTLSPIAKESGVVIAADLPPEPVIVLGDRDELLRVTENLIENAVKYGESGGRVDVLLKENAERSQVEFSVRDYGPGIAPEHLPRLTERFYRADVVQSRQKGGTGLGLAIVKHIVNRHRGQLTIESEVGQGALFKVQLPQVAPPAA
ncbi:ATP-binding protein [Microvirga flavescens]|uniref:ATP-binding protein n=1 Tax=Microvirga flavescens TaxID=2249811 RepID=UPI001FE0AAA7|nr:ATP-binding protein [Microvirga flavescens]